MISALPMRQKDALPFGLSVRSARRSARRSLPLFFSGTLWALNRFSPGNALDESRPATAALKPLAAGDAHLGDHRAGRGRGACHPRRDGGQRPAQPDRQERKSARRSARQGRHRLDRFARAARGQRRVHRPEHLDDAQRLAPRHRPDRQPGRQSHRRARRPARQQARRRSAEARPRARSTSAPISAATSR